MSDRILKLNQKIRKDVGQIIEQNFYYPQTLITVTEAITSKDLSEAKIYISIYPVKNGEKILKLILQKTPEFQKILNEQLIIRKIPKIKFELDKRTEEADKIEQLLEKIKEKE